MDQKKKVLVVDDSKELSGIMKEMLDFKGYEASIANDGNEGVRLALKTHPDLILLDLRMPEIDGYEVIRQLQKDAWGKTAKILMLTAVGDVGEIPPDIELSPSDYLVKSLWGIENVETKIKQKIAEA